MYEIDERDQVDELGNVPRSSVGAPLPVVLSVEGKVVLSFYLQNEPEDGDGESSRVITEEWEETIAIIEFDKCYAHMFGPPNDESFSGHPLATHGLRPYETYEVLNSSWLRRLERMNSVHPYHNSEKYWKRHHYVFAFRDSTFECIANGFEIDRTHGPTQSVIPKMSEKLLRR